jgi:hypothetical protein
MNTNEFDDLIISKFQWKGEKEWDHYVTGGKHMNNLHKVGKTNASSHTLCVHVIDGERGSGRKIEKISHEVW